MIRVIALLCQIAHPAICHEQTVTTSDFAAISLQSCLMGAPQLADFMRAYPQYRLAGWKCQIGARKQHA